MANFKIPNLCGASAELNAASSKIADLESKIASQIDAVASEAAAAVNTALADVKAGLDGLALDLPSIPSINFQSELTSLVSDFNLTTPQGIAQYTSKLAELEKDFGDTLTKAGKSLDSLITDATAAVSGGGDLCAIAPNLELPAAGGDVVEKAQGVKTALKNAADEVKSIIVKNANVETKKTELKAKVEAVKSGNSFTPTTKSTPIVTPTGKSIKATTSKDAVTTNENGEKVRSTKSADGIAGKYKTVLEVFWSASEFDRYKSGLSDKFNKGKGPSLISLDGNSDWEFYILPLKHEPVEIKKIMWAQWELERKLDGDGLVAKMKKTNPLDPNNLAVVNSPSVLIGKTLDFGPNAGSRELKLPIGNPLYIAVRYNILDTTDSNYV